MICEHLERVPWLLIKINANIVGSIQLTHLFVGSISTRSHVSRVILDDLAPVESAKTTTAPITIKKHGRKTQSWFRYGLDYLQDLLINPEQQAQHPLNSMIQLLT